MQNEMGARKKFIVGQFYKGCLREWYSRSRDWKQWKLWSNYDNLQEHQSLVLYTTAKLEKEDIFKLWTVVRFDCLDNWGITPDIDINGLLDRNRIQYLYISKKHLYLDPSNGRYCYTRIEFESLNDRLSDTGYSIANYVQPALAGVGYARSRLKPVPEHEIPLPQRHDYQPNPNLILNAKIPPARYHSTVRGVKYYAAIVLDPWKVIDVGVWGAQVKIDKRLSFTVSDWWVILFLMMLICTKTLTILKFTIKAMSLLPDLSLDVQFLSYFSTFLSFAVIRGLDWVDCLYLNR
jgi:hypothetical protein